MALSVVLSLALLCATWPAASGAGALLPSYQLLLPFPAGPAAPAVAAPAVAAPASRLLVLLPGSSPQQLAATALDAAHQQVEAASARVSPLPPQPSRADFQARAQALSQQQQQLQQQQQQLQQQQQQLQEDSVAASRASFQPTVRGRLDFQQQARQQQQSDYQQQVLGDVRGEYASQPMRPSGLGRALQTPSYQALVADYRFRQQQQQQQQQLQQQASSYQPLASEYQYRQPPRASYQGVSTEYQYRQQPAQLQAVSSPSSRADFRPGPYPLAARASLAQQQQQAQQQQAQQEYQLQQQQQEYQQQATAYDAPRPEFRSLQPQGLLPGQEYSVNFEGDGFGYGYTIRGDHNTQRAY